MALKTGIIVGSRVCSLHGGGGLKIEAILKFQLIGMMHLTMAHVLKSLALLAESVLYVCIKRIFL